LAELIAADIGGGMSHDAKHRRTSMPTCRAEFRMLSRMSRRLLSFGVIVALVSSALGLTVSTTAGASSVTGVSFYATNYAAHTVTTWTVNFSTGGVGPLYAGSTITIAFPAGFSSPSPAAVTLGSAFVGTNCVETNAWSASTLTITLANSTTTSTCGIANGYPLSLQIAGVTNPAAGSYSGSAFTVATSSDTTPQGAEDVETTIVITGGSVGEVSNVTFQGTSTAANVVTPWIVGFTPASSLSSGSLIYITFAPGFGVPNPVNANAVSGFGLCSIGSSIVTGQNISLALGSVGCSIPGGTPVQLQIPGITNPSAGSYTNTEFQVWTDIDTTPNSPTTNVVIGGTGSVTTTAATAVTSGGATLNGTDNPGGSAQTCNFAYGTSSVLTAATIVAAPSPGSGTTAVPVSLAVTGLAANTTYYFQLECSNGNGGILSFFTANGTPLPIQIYGVDPIGTSIAISETEFPTNGSAAAVVLARDDYFSDALAGGPLAASVGGPMLLTEGAPISSSLDSRTQAEIQRVLPSGGTVYILGGTLAISSNVDSTLASLGYKVVREAGSDAFATAVDIAQQMGNPSTIFEATGTAYYDALSAVPAAIKEHAAILLTNGNVQAPETAAYLSAHPGDIRYTIGGPLAAAGADPTATAVYGNDLYATSAAVASTFFPAATIFGAATSATFTDALGGGVFMATGGRSGPLLIVNPSAPLPSEILPYLASLAVGTQGYVFGGPLAVGSDVLAALQQAVG
jgi:putative cell wall-binding protein